MKIQFIYTNLSYGSKTPEIQSVLKNIIETKILNHSHHLVISKEEGEDEKYLKKYFDRRKLCEIALTLIVEVLRVEFHLINHDEWLDMIKFNNITFTNDLTNETMMGDYSGMIMK